MKRKNNIYPLIYSKENLMQAAKNAMKGKMKQYGVRVFLRDVEANIELLHQMLVNKTYRTSEYKHRIINEGKERKISILKFFPDRIAHHAIMIPLEPLFVSTFTADTYSCIKGRGISKAVRAVKKMLKDIPGTTYCLKIDIQKFYPSVDLAILMTMIKRLIKDKDLLDLLQEIIHSAPGLPIGNYPSQFFANFYLTPLDRFIKETLGVKHYARYLDDMVIFSESKEHLHQLQGLIIEFLETKLKLALNRHRQVFRVDDRGVDFCGVKAFHGYALLRDRIKRSFCRTVAKHKNRPASPKAKAAISGLVGWMQYANTKNLINKILKPNESIQRAGGKIKEPDR